MEWNITKTFFLQNCFDEIFLCKAFFTTNVCSLLCIERTVVYETLLFFNPQFRLITEASAKSAKTFITMHCLYAAFSAPIPSRLEFSDITHTSIRVSWNITDYPDEDFIRYIVTYKLSDGNGKEEVIEVVGKYNITFQREKVSQKTNM